MANQGKPSASAERFLGGQPLRNPGCRWSQLESEFEILQQEWAECFPTEQSLLLTPIELDACVRRKPSATVRPAVGEQWAHVAELADALESGSSE